MKHLYQCERCGQFFDDYCEAQKHEYSHYTPDVDNYDEVKGEFLHLETRATYREGQEEPNTVHIRMSRYNPHTGKMEYRFGKYRLVSSYSAPLEVVPDDMESK